MDDKLLHYLAEIAGPASGFLAAAIGLYNRALMSDIRKEMAEMENHIFVRINGTYARTSECQMRHDSVAEKCDSLLDLVRDNHRVAMSRKRTD